VDAYCRFILGVVLNVAWQSSMYNFYFLQNYIYLSMTMRMTFVDDHEMKQMTILFYLHICFGVLNEYSKYFLILFNMFLNKNCNFINFRNIYIYII